MNSVRNHAIKLIAAMAILVGVVVGNWHLSRCTVLCDKDFWSVSPSSDEAAAELSFFTDLSKSRATGLKLFTPQEASFTPLHWAARRGDADTIGLLIDAGAPVNATAAFSQTPLYFAVSWGRDPKITALLLAAGADPNIEAFAIYKTPLLVAVQFQEFEVFSLLVAAGADVEGLPMLRRALERDDLRFAELVIKNGANVHERALLYNTAAWGTLGAVSLLLEAGADPRLENRDGFRTGLHGFGRNGDLAALEALLDAGAEINVRDQFGRTPLSRAMTNSNSDIIWRMIAAGAEIYEPESWSTALHSASAVNPPNLEIIEFVIAEGADPNYRDRKDITPLHLVAEGDGVEIAAALVAAGTDIDALDNNGDTPFLLALKKNNLPMAQAFIRLGADTEATGKAGHGALFYAVRFGGKKMLSLALGQTSNANPRDDDGNTPLMFARTSILIEMLLNAGADINATNAFGQTPLHIAAQSGLVGWVQTLIAGGANTRAVDNEGHTPKDLVSHTYLIADKVTMEMLNQ